jgi:hypothetical protein
MSVKASFSALSGIAFAALLGTAVLAGCGGGGTSSTVPTTTTTTAQTPSSGSNVSIGSLDLNQPASSTAVNLTSTTPAGPTVDVRDASTIAVDSSAGVGMPTFSDANQHVFKGSLAVGSSSSSAHRAAKDVAVNSPYDLTYFGGPVLGSAVSHDLFLNCQAGCRQTEWFFPGVFLADLNQDQFVTLLYQYRTSPGVTLGSPVGSYTKGVGADLTATYASPRPGSTNPYFGQLAIWLQVLNAAGPPGHPNIGGGGLAHIYHVFLPKNVDTCQESPPGTPGSHCYSPDNGATFFFCAYHGAFTATSGNQRQTYLYTVEPYQDVNGCRNVVGNRSLPNPSPSGGNPADPGYSTLSHELFETITDPLLNAWFNGLTGNEIGDLCSSFDNFVTVNGNKYVLQSEYSDVRHLCVSGNLTNPSGSDGL